jgi:hypothetical protein
MHGEDFRAYLRSFAGPASAGADYDGDWSILIVWRADRRRTVIYDRSNGAAMRGQATPKGTRRSLCDPAPNGSAARAISAGLVAAAFRGSTNRAAPGPAPGIAGRA